VLTNRKRRARKGKVQLIDATETWMPMRKSLGNKRREIPREKAVDILAIHASFEEGERSKLFPPTHFGYRKITVERPLRLNFQASAERIARLDAEGAFRALAASKKKDAKARAKEEAEGGRSRRRSAMSWRSFRRKLFKDREKFREALREAAKASDSKLSAPIEKALLSALSERDETAEICRDKDRHPEPDPELRDTEMCPSPRRSRPNFEREVKPHVPDAWIDTTKARREGQAGRHRRLRDQLQTGTSTSTCAAPAREIETDIRAIETDIVRMLAE